MNRWNRMSKLTDAALVRHLSPSLKAALDAELAACATPAEILGRVRALTGGPRSPRGGLTYLGCEAYLASRAKA